MTEPAPREPAPDAPPPPDDADATAPLPRAGAAAESTDPDATPTLSEVPHPRHRVVCPQCKSRYKLPRSVLHRRVRCRHCGHVWREEGAAAQAVSDALSAAAAAWSRQGATALDAIDHASTIGLLATKHAPRPVPAPGEWIGRRVGRYEIKAILGQGAMGHVYEAYDASLQRAVALKLLPRQFEPGSDHVGLKLFLQEARVAAALQHPNIVTVYEIGEDDGVHFFAMELVHGVTLLSLIQKNGALPASQACYIIAHAARALAAAHARGVVHRDVKPGNIMIDDQGRVKVTDFGLADVEGLEGIAELSEKALGTPGWISPEAARGERATPASDIYGLGLCLFYALSGRRAIKAKTRSAMLAVQREAKSLRREETPEDWPDRLRDIVVQCLQADPAARYQSAETLAGELLLALHPGDSDPTIMLDQTQGNGPDARGTVSPLVSWLALGVLSATAVTLAWMWYRALQ